jgi:hypothetical protein
MMMVRAKHRCEADIGSESPAEGKFRFFMAKRPVAPEWIRSKLADMQKCPKRIAWTHVGWRSFIRAAIATVLFAVGCATMLAGPADPKGKSKVQLDPSRELYVDIAPAVTDAFAWTEFINDRFYGQVERAFRQGRYKGKMAHVLVTGDPPKVPKC